MKPLDSSPPCATIKRWEEASASLESAFKDYLDMCLGLGIDSLRRETQYELVPKIDFTLSTTHIHISHYLKESSYVLVRTRNKLASTLYKFPEEVLSEIFLNVVYDHSDSQGSQTLSMRQEVRLIYHRLYSLIGACSRWRDILMGRGTFWSVIPMVSNPLTKREGPFELCLHRAGGSRLHLAVDHQVATSSTDLAAVLANHGSRLRAINICVDDNDDETMRNVVSELLKHVPHGSLSELSIQLSDSESSDISTDLPEDSDYIVFRDSPQQASFSRLAQSLTAFRLYGTRFHWDTLTFSTRLVELRIERVLLGYDDMIASFLQTLSSATGLQDLKIIAISTFRKRSSTPLSAITFPALQSLSIEDLYLNTLEHLLPMIAPGSHRLTLLLSSDSLDINVLEGEDADDEAEGHETNINGLDALCGLLEHTSIDTLKISDDRGGEWLTGSGLTQLVRSIPTLKTLKMDGWCFDKDLCRRLTQSKNTPTTSATVVTWVRRSIPDLKLRLTEQEYCSPKFYRDEWRLW
ncbi:hypothetical protein RSOL_156850 [Rhizoctonia solani AG-3 Rhs1AP]|uniref:F-box-like domain protein n=2 Tax=Rhizoctonia solani AG-3 TaxID=1086053 RepID=A0A074RSJ3_9AGAM|nr:hypothetical protein RSOL_156850 [Rhizoctonia solani AG-3 Rhs1AP]KEP49829.1 hypothetical protein V565_092220 [Rhizoctonia solani 123E]